jgi:hypothetical protein
VLLAEELALIALDPDSGRHALGTRDNLNACLAGLLIAELQLDDRPESPLLSAAAEVVAEAGPKPKAVLSAMSRGLERHVGMGTWDAVVAGLVDAGVVAPSSGGLRPRHQVLDRAGRDAIVARLRMAASGDDPMAVRTDATSLEPISESVRQVLAEAAAVVATSVAVTTAATTSG